MPLQEVRDAKETLRKEIVVLLDQFESEYGIKVTRISDFRSNVITKTYKDFYRSHHDLEIDLERI